MTLESNLNSLYYSEFSQSELSLIKLLVLSELQSYRGINGCYQSGNIHSLLLQLRQKIVVFRANLVVQLVMILVRFSLECV